MAALKVGCSEVVLQLELLWDLGIKEVKRVLNLAESPNVTIEWFVLARKIHFLEWGRTRDWQQVLTNVQGT